ncbi:uncharacterized protein LOC122264157 isoform X2 [Penaeus japonicus]|uniref:uncharacterized protein LOC122264157 isoform X2 n=1 Tax=Penaeus japonicus TaxID=27405 RepID=UPI001C7138C1|nr:uncharacterized protein LOC122264157 isoform X2 [Penaeus japonicus]
MAMNILLTICLMCTPVICFQFRKDCVSGRHFETDSIGTSWDVRAWVPKEDEGARILTLVSNNDARLTVRKIDVTRTEVRTLFMQGSYRERNTSLIAGEGISPGWQEFRVTSDSRFTVWAAGVDEPLVDVEDEVGAEKIDIKGSNVTVNCREPLTVWNVSDVGETAVPLEGPGRYNLTVFSRSPSLPVLRLGAQRRVLSWDPKGSTITTFTTEPQALPGFIQHNFTVDCSQAENHFSCGLLAGQNDTLVGSVSLPHEIYSLSFHGRNGEHFIVIFQHTVTDVDAPPTSLNNSFEENVASRGYLFYEQILRYAPIFVNAILAVAVAVLYVKNKKLKMVIADAGLKDSIQEPSVWRKLFWDFLELFKRKKYKQRENSQSTKTREMKPLKANAGDKDEAVTDEGGDGDALQNPGHE